MYQLMRALNSKEGSRIVKGVRHATVLDLVVVEVNKRPRKFITGFEASRYLAVNKPLVM